MKTIDIQKHTGPIEAFDDPEYCGAQSNGQQCKFLDTPIDSEWCSLWEAELLVNGYRLFPSKCNQCKTAYQKTIND